jgi:hypothetical protein
MHTRRRISGSMSKSTKLSTARKHYGRVWPKDKVLIQIGKFQKGQQDYRQKAKAAAEKWLNFDLELARSLRTGQATLPVERFIAVLQDQWHEDDLTIINQHEFAGMYLMSEQLAAILERKQRQLVTSQTAIATGNQAVIRQADGVTMRLLQRQIMELETQRGSLTDAEYAWREAELMRNLARQNFKVGGGCAGEVGGEKGTDGLRSGSSGAGINEARDGESESSGSWTWKKGVCRIKSCPSPKPTDVGPCSICRGCQHKFDSGQDPTTSDSPSHVESAAATPSKDKVAEYIRAILNPKIPPKRSELALAA